MNVNLFTDGSLNSEREFGGWAYLMFLEQEGMEALSSGALCTNDASSMELLAVQQGIAAAPKNAHIHLHSDSKYVGHVLNKISLGRLTRTRDRHLQYLIEQSLKDRMLTFNLLSKNKHSVREHALCHLLAFRARRALETLLHDGTVTSSSPLHSASPLQSS